MACQEQSKLNGNKKAYTLIQRTLLEHAAQVIEKIAPLGTKEQLLHKVNLSRLGDVADLFNT